LLVSFRLLVGMCAWFGLPAAGQAAVRALDDRGQMVALQQPAARVVSLVPSATEAVCALGACERLVAVDRWSNWPAAIQHLPRVGGLDDANIERIAAQRPDLVLVAPASRVAARLRKLGMAVAEIDTHTLGDVNRMLSMLGTLLGREEAARQVWQNLGQQIDLAATSVAASARRARIYIELSSSPHAAGPSSYLGELLARLGGTNIVPPHLGAFPVLTPEFIVRADPDLIIVARGGVDAMKARPGWSSLRAVRQGLICVVEADDYDVLVRPGPRLGEAAVILARCMGKAVRGTP